MRIPMSTSFRLVSAAAALLLVGCAVTTIDVDVYKGPLVNEQEVQIQQTVNLAFAAKPLLGRLRYELEKAHHDRLLQSDDMPPTKRSFLEHSYEYVDPCEYARTINQERATAKDNEGKAKKGKQGNVKEDEAKEDEAEKDAPKLKQPQPKLLGTNGAHFVNQIFLHYRDPVIDAQAEAEPDSTKNVGAAQVGVREIYASFSKQLESLADKGSTRAREIINARGSSRMGLESLNRVYITELQRAKGDHREDSVVLARTELFNALLQFAQQLTLMVDNESLFAREVPGVPEILWGVGRAIFAGESDQDAADRSYVRVLQLVGNSIAVQINELQNQAKYSRGLEDAKGREIAGLEAATRRPPRQVIADLREALLVEIAGLRRQLNVEPDDPPVEEVTKAQQAAMKRLEEAKAGLVPVTASVEKLQTAASIAADAAALVASGTLRGLASPKVSVPPTTMPSEGTHVLKQLAEAAKLATSTDASAVARLKAVAQYLTTLQLTDSDKKRVSEAVDPTQVQATLAEIVAEKHEEQERQYVAERRRLIELEQQRDNAAAAIPLWRKHIKLSLALAGVRDVGPKLLASGKLDDAAEPAVTRDEMIVEIREEIAAETTRGGPAAPRRIERLKEVEKYVNAWKLPTAGIKVEGSQTAEEVMDALIATLRHEHIQAVRRAGEGSEEAKRFAEALETAYGQRAGMQYIRPASAFLRTSYPATTLQRGTRVGWKNMLGEHAGRQVPGADLFPNDPDLRTIRELDKQYWQNINTIRVAGSGDTNYVMVKDDIGNWYVKNYSADPKDIIKSAQNLAMFGLGPSLGAPGLLAASIEQDIAAGVTSGNVKAKDAIEQLNELNKATAATPAQPGGGGGAAVAGGGGSPGTPPGAPPLATPVGPVLGRQLHAAQTFYNDATAKDLADVQADATKLKNAVAEAWKKEDALKGYHLQPALDEAAALYLDKVKDVKAADGSVRDADALLAGLRLMKQFHGELAGKLVAQASKTAEAMLNDANEEHKKAQEESEKATKEHEQAKGELTETSNKLAEVNKDLEATGLADDKRTELAKQRDELSAKETELNARLPKLEKVVSDKKATAEKHAAVVKAAQEKLAKAADAAAAARARLTTIVRETIAETMTRREQVLARYETELDLIGRTVAAP